MDLVTFDAPYFLVTVDEPYSWKPYGLMEWASGEGEGYKLSFSTVASTQTYTLGYAGAGEYKRFAKEYGMTDGEVAAFVRANDRGVPFNVLAEILGAAPVPHTTELTQRRIEDERRLVADLERVTLEYARARIVCKCLMCSGVGFAWSIKSASAL